VASAEMHVSGAGRCEWHTKTSARSHAAGNALMVGLELDAVSGAGGLMGLVCLTCPHISARILRPTRWFPYRHCDNCAVMLLNPSGSLQESYFRCVLCRDGYSGQPQNFV
jgi:hypothetical protein